MGFNNVSTEPLRISLVIPCYNPSEGWSNLILKRMQELKAIWPAYELECIISNDGSTRLQMEEVERLSRETGILFLNNQENQGKGASIRKGAASSHGEIIIYTDIDFPFGIEPVVEMVELLQVNPRCQFVYGARSKQYFRQLPFKRKVISQCLKMLNVFLLSPRIKDTQAGIKALRREVLNEMLATQTNSFVFEIELIRKLMQRKVEIRSVAVSPEPGLVFSDFGSQTLWRELINLVRIFTRKAPVATAVEIPMIEIQPETYAGGYADF
ncbi:hypothetical protein BWI96_18230 [Siphonobacter sp. SORGH_AS_0500]|nr:glycosyltransferase involved in cell wall biosynthesis [Siphonobacter sp. SORGH_AS_1065]PKK35151.1 hypothetical protein BWI96_18230 [Siphonobacter sp. SORGH_AS_0500]